MNDLIAVVLMVVLFPVALLYIAGCERLKPQRGSVR
jgi:hypothetical protein